MNIFYATLDILLCVLLVIFIFGVISNKAPVNTKISVSDRIFVSSLAFISLMEAVNGLLEYFKDYA